MFPSLQIPLPVTVDTEREWKLVQRLDEFSADCHTLNLQQVPRGMTTHEVSKFVREKCAKNTKLIIKSVPWHRHDVKLRTSNDAATVMSGRPILKGLSGALSLLLVSRTPTLRRRQHFMPL